MGLFSASGSCWHEPLLQLWNFSVANPFSFEVRTWFKSFSLSECPVFGKPGGRASVGELPDQFRDPEPTLPRTSQLAFHATCLHGCCAGSRLSHARRRVTSLCAHKSRSMRTGLLVGPLCGALDPLVGRCWAMVPLGLHLCLVKPHPRASARCVTYIGVRAFGGRVVCEAGAARGPLVRSRYSNVHFSVEPPRRDRLLGRQSPSLLPRQGLCVSNHLSNCASVRFGPCGPGAELLTAATARPRPRPPASPFPPPPFPAGCTP